MSVFFRKNRENTSEMLPFSMNNLTSRPQN